MAKKEFFQHYIKANIVLERNNVAVTITKLQVYSIITWVLEMLMTISRIHLKLYLERTYMMKEMEDENNINDR